MPSLFLPDKNEDGTNLVGPMRPMETDSLPDHNYSMPDSRKIIEELRQEIEQLKNEKLNIFQTMTERTCKNVKFSIIRLFKPIIS